MLKVCLTLIIVFGEYVGIGNTSIKKTELIEEIVIKELTLEERIIKVLQDSGYSKNMQQLILAKADFESGGFKNKLTREHNNVFSMLHSKRDPYSKCGCGFAEGRKGYASYPTIEDQVYAYIWYTKKKHYPKEATPYQYVAYMKSKGYFVGDPKLSDKENIKMYLNGILSRINKYNAYASR
jgi:hypothetical protein